MADVYLCLLLSIAVSLALRCQAIDNSEDFAAGKLVGHVIFKDLDDASGLAASRKFKNVLYTHSDGGGGPYIYAINETSGSLIATFRIANAKNHDWEDIAVGPCGNSTCIYIADSGQNYHSKSSANTIYRVLEPDFIIRSMDQDLPLDSIAQYTWSEEQSETLMVDPKGEVYLIGYVCSGRGMVSHLPKSAWGSPNPVNIDSSQFLPINTDHHDPVSGDISMDGSKLLIKSKYHIFYWRIEGSDVLGSLTTTPVEVPYHYEGNGDSQAVCWSADGQNYYTLPEGHNPPLYIYTRNNTRSPDIVGNLIGK
ncbi:uncharacterized protein LOC134257345 [Saccostrea cucullata]|uniref:uncharacterized protein LOC134257345 n=1 Tax=Saccostrea cuccullata TaxID=36930 RepID=UPI002ECFCF77